MASNDKTSKKFLSDNPSIADILDYKKPLETECKILVDPSVQQEAEKLREELIAAQRAERQSGGSLADKPASAIQDEIDKLYEDAENVVVTFKFRAIGRKRLDELARQHPPTKEQQKAYRELGAQGTLEFNPDTFGAYLIAESCYEPAMTLEQAQEIWDNWSRGETEVLFTTALQACVGRASLPFSKRGTAKT